jgi:CheY-like chemotaxis protein
VGYFSGLALATAAATYRLSQPIFFFAIFCVVLSSCSICPPLTNVARVSVDNDKGIPKGGFCPMGMEGNHRRTVLIVDDEPVICEVLSGLFQKHGCAVFTAPEGAAALRICRTYPVDLVISDLAMPDQDGFELVRQLRSEFPATKIMIMSGLSNPEGYLKASRHLGADAALTKPFTLPAIWSSAEALLAGNSAIIEKILPGESKE